MESFWLKIKLSNFYLNEIFKIYMKKCIILNKIIMRMQ